MRAYIDIAPRLGAEWIVVHAGYHFTADVPERVLAGLDRLRRMVAYAETREVRLLLENLNKEPVDAEVHYLAHTVPEWRTYYDAIHSPAFGLSFTANHAHLMLGRGRGLRRGYPIRACDRGAAGRLLFAMATNSIWCPARVISTSAQCSR